MKTDLILFNTKENLGFDKILKVDIINIKSKDQLRKLNKENLNILEGGKFNREILENKNADILISPEKDIKKDFIHHRNSGLNQVLCKLAKKNNIAIAFNFNEILGSKDRPLLIGRIKQNIRLCRKYKVKMIFASFAKDKYGQRTYHDLLTFSKVLGMNSKEALECFEAIDKIIKNKKGLVIPGLKIIDS